MDDLIPDMPDWFRQYLENLCEDISGLLFEGGSGAAIVVEGVAVDVDDAGRILLENDDGVVAIPVGDVVHLRTLALHAVEDAS